MQLRMTITFDPFEVSAPTLKEKVMEAGVKSEQIATGPARAPKVATKKAAKVEAR